MVTNTEVSKCVSLNVRLMLDLPHDLTTNENLYDTSDNNKKDERGKHRMQLVLVAAGEAAPSWKITVWK